jgi:DNA-binding transcriptional regulator YiaG
MSTPKMRILRIAAETLGNQEALAKRLGVTHEDVANWLSGKGVPNDGVYLTLLDIVAGSNRAEKPRYK